MCLILFGHRNHPRYPTILVANRDEFYDRPTAPMGYWEDHTHILAGRDLKMMGTWFGITPAGRWAAITNYRQPGLQSDTATSRGHLISDFLRGHAHPADYLKGVAAHSDRYAGFNLLAGDPRGLYYYSNRAQAPMELAPGIHGLSNHLLDTPWPKVSRGTKALSALLQSDDRLNPEDLLKLLQDEAPAPDHQLPDTGVGMEWERLLSPMFISSPNYGTRASTVLTIDNTGLAQVLEVTWQPGQTPPVEVNRQSYCFALEAN